MSKVPALKSYPSEGTSQMADSEFELRCGDSVHLSTDVLADESEGHLDFRDKYRPAHAPVTAWLAYEEVIRFDESIVEDPNADLRWELEEARYRHVEQCWSTARYELASNITGVDPALTLVATFHHRWYVWHTTVLARDRPLEDKELVKA